MKKYEVLYTNRKVEVVDFETVDKLIDELEMFERFDVSQIHELEDNGELGETIWTEEEGLFVRGFGYDTRDDEDEEEDDDEYYLDGTELFDEGLSNIIGTIESILEDLDLTEENEKVLHDKLIKVKEDPEILQDIKNFCMDRVCDNDTICNYISDYTVSELGDMDGIWNEFMDTIRDSIYEYFDF
jgi:hypothetical protein